MHRFRLYPAEGMDEVRPDWFGPYRGGVQPDLYWKVMVTANHGWFKRYARVIAVDREAHESFRYVQAVVFPETQWDIPPRKKGQQPKRAVIQPALGYALFHAENLNAEIAAHEAVHMATGYLRRVRHSLKLRSQCDLREEFLAYLVGRITDQLAKEFRKRKLWK